MITPRKYTAMSLARQLASVTRYSRDFSVHRESVLEHTGFCVLYCLSIAQQLQLKKIDIDIGKLLTRAVLHDIEEAETGDISRTSKYHSPETLKAFKEHESSSAASICADVFAATSFYDWQMAKDNSIEGRIVGLSDLAAVAYHVSNELFVLGNKSFLRVQTEALRYLQERYETETQTVLIEEIRRIERVLRGNLPA